MSRSVEESPQDQSMWDALRDTCRRDARAIPVEAARARFQWALADVGDHYPIRDAMTELLTRSTGAWTLLGAVPTGDTRFRMPTDAEIRAGLDRVREEQNTPAVEAMVANIANNLNRPRDAKLDDSTCAEIHQAGALVYQITGYYGGYGGGGGWSGPSDGSWFGFRDYRPPQSGCIQTRMTVGQARGFVANFAAWSYRRREQPTMVWPFDPNLTPEQVRDPGLVLSKWTRGSSPPFVLLARCADGMLVSVTDVGMWRDCGSLDISVQSDVALLVAGRASSSTVIPDLAARDLIAQRTRT